MPLSSTLQNIPIQIFRPKEHFLSLLMNQIREDGRQLSQFRSLQIIKLPISKKVEILQPSQSTTSSSWILSSVQVTLGETIILCAITGIIHTSSSSSSSEGSIGCTMSMNHFYPFSKGELVDQKPALAVELEQYILDVLIKGNIVNRKELVLIENESVLQLGIQFTLLSYNGNLKDTCYYAAISALHEVVIPEIEILLQPISSTGIKDTVEPTRIKLNYDSNQRLSLKYAIPLTMGFFNNGDSISSSPLTYLFMDPTEKEERYSDGSVSVVYHPVQDTFHYIAQSSNGLPHSLLLKTIEQQRELLRTRYEPLLVQIQS